MISKIKTGDLFPLIPMLPPKETALFYGKMKLRVAFFPRIWYNHIVKKITKTEVVLTWVV